MSRIDEFRQEETSLIELENSLDDKIKALREELEEARRRFSWWKNKPSELVNQLERLRNERFQMQCDQNIEGQRDKETELQRLIVL